MRARRSVAIGLLVLLGGCTAVSPNATPLPTQGPLPPSSAVPASPAARCGDFGEAEQDPRTNDWYDVVLGTVAMPVGGDLTGPLADHNHYDAPDGTRYYFMKSGLPVWDRAVVTITSADGTALMNWNRSDNPPTTSQTLGPCGDPGTWHVYGAGGFFVPAEGCYDFIVEVGRKTTTVTIQVGGQDC